MSGSYSHTSDTPVRLPPLALIEQQGDATALADVHAAIRASVQPHIPAAIQPGMRVAITAGSRGISQIDQIIAALVADVQRQGATPSVVAAMGSHGGATAEGQRAVLGGYGITEAAVGCPIISAMETTLLGHTEAGIPVYCDAFAAGCDAIILCNRVKPHSLLTGSQGSGLMKMAAVGLGKADGARTLHASGMTEHMLPAARLVLATAPVRLGVAIVENAYDQPYSITCVPAADIPATDQRLLTVARERMLAIPFDPVDVLIIDTIGKDIAGTGMDPNIIGMHRRIGGAPERTIHYIVALDLSPASHGNAHGVGMADFITARLRDKIDQATTYTNSLTAGFPAGSRLPLTCRTAHDAVALAVRPFAPDRVRVVRIQSTAHLEQMWVSPALLSDLPHYPQLAQRSPPRPPTLPEHGTRHCTEDA